MRAPSRAPWFIALAGLVLVGGCWRESDEKAAKEPERMTVPLQGGKPDENAAFLTPTELAAKADVPLYPGAETPDGKSSVKDGDAESRYEIVMRTSDSASKVLAFYESKLTRSQKMTDGDGIMGTTSKGNYVIVKVAKEEDQTLVTLVAMATRTKSR